MPIWWPSRLPFSTTRWLAPRWSVRCDQRVHENGVGGSNLQQHSNLAQWQLKYLFHFHPPKTGEDFQFDECFFFHMGWFNHQPGKCWEFCGSFGFAVLWLKDGLGLLLCQPEVASACRTTPKKHGKCPSETAHVSSAWCSRLHPRDSCWRCRWKKSNAVRLNSSGGPGQCPACRSDWLPLLPAQAQGHYQSPWAHDWDELTPKKVICFARSLVVSTPFF